MTFFDGFELNQHVHYPTCLNISDLTCRPLFPEQDVGAQISVQLSPPTATPPKGDHVSSFLPGCRVVKTLTLGSQESQRATLLPPCQLTATWYVKFCHLLVYESTIKSNPEPITWFVWSYLCKQIPFMVLLHREITTQPTSVQRTALRFCSLALTSTMDSWLKQW